MASTRQRRLGALVLLAALAVGTASCGGGDSAVDKSPDELNFSLQSAEDAGLYGARDFILPSETGSGETDSVETDSVETETDSTDTDTTETTPTAPSPGYSEYESLTDETGAIAFEAPVEWAHHESGMIGPFQTSLTASPDIDGMLSTWTVPGVLTAASKSLGAYVADAAIPELALPTVFAAVSPREELSRDCLGRLRSFLIGPSDADNLFSQELSDVVDFGLVDMYSDCGGNGTIFMTGAGFSEVAGTFVYFMLTLTSEADLDALGTYLSTLQIDYAKVPAPTSDQLQPDLRLP